MRTSALLALLGLVIVGCSPNTPTPSAAAVGTASPAALETAPPSQATAPSSLLPPSPAVSPSAAPTQEQIREAAGTAYLAAVKPFNKSLDALYKVYKNQTSLPANRRYCAKLAAATHTFVTRIRAIVYPDDTAADVKALIRSDTSSEADLRTCAKARSFTEWNKYWNLSIKASDRSHEAANLVRLDLNLPSVPG